MTKISKERADEINAAWQAATMTERLSLPRCQWFTADDTTYWELPPTELETFAAKRIAELEERLRIWRDDYQRSPGGSSVSIPVHQIVALIGEKTTEA